MLSSKVLVIGLDGMTFDLLGPLFEKGLMPHLQSFQRNSYNATLLSTVPPISATAWMTLATGVNPGSHGILQFVTLRPNQEHAGRGREVFPGGFSLLNANSVRATTLWKLLSDSRKRQIVVNVPLTFPPQPINGVMVTGMMTPPSAKIFTYPAALSETLEERGYEIDLSMSEKDFGFEPHRLMERLHQLMLNRADITLDLMRNEPWDFCMLVFTGTDRLQHRFWKLLVPGYPEYQSAEATRVRPRLEQYFRALDDAIGELVSAAGPDATVIILSDHGFGAVSERTVYRLSMMQLLGVTTTSMKSPTIRLRNLLEGRLGLTPDRTRKLISYILPEKWVGQLEARARQAQLAATARDPAYSVTLHEYVGGIYINQDLLFAEGNSYEVYRQRIIAGLKELTDPDRPVPLISKVHRREELYEGSALEDCPDIIFYLTEGYGLSGGVGPNGKLVSERRNEPNKQGTHRDEGILMIKGPGIRKQHQAREHLIDVPSTILYLLGVPIPTMLDSRPILRALNEKLVKKSPPDYVKVATRAGGISASDEFDSTEMEISEEDAEELLARLRNLGYIE